MQVSHGFLRNPEALDPGDVRRTTASISYNKPFERGNWASSLIWGRNHEGHGGEIFNLNGYVAESTLKFLDRNYLYTRLELTDKTRYCATPIASVSASPITIRRFASELTQPAARAIFGTLKRRLSRSAAT